MLFKRKCYRYDDDNILKATDQEHMTEAPTAIEEEVAGLASGAARHVQVGCWLSWDWAGRLLTFMGCVQIELLGDTEYIFAQ